MSERDARPGGGCGFLEYHVAHDFWIEGDGSGRRVHCTGLYLPDPPAVPPGPCWHDSGIVFPGKTASFRCDLLAGHAGAHEADRGVLGGTAVWTDAEATR